MMNIIEFSPEARFKSLLACNDKFAIDHNVKARVYYKSGVNMYEQFNTFYKERNWENALSIYFKYKKLFCDKIKNHPEYDKVPVNIKSVNASNFRIIKAKADHARKELLKQYQIDYDSFVEEFKTNRFEENPASSSIKQLPFKKEQHDIIVPLAKVSKLELNSRMSFETARKMNDQLKLIQETESQQDPKGKETPPNKETGGYRSSIISNTRVTQKLSYMSLKSV